MSETQNELPAEDPSGELSPEEWAIFRDLAQRANQLHGSAAALERWTKGYEAELDRAEGDIAVMLYGAVSYISEFTTGIAFRALAQYLAEREPESFGHGMGTAD
jgi:hypothetical protein